MRKETLSILVCPGCHSRLELKDACETETEIISGNLYCKKCDVYFPIENKIANMLPPELRNTF
jgi:uncharacterized protein YbaR (Trm112 family)